MEADVAGPSALQKMEEQDAPERPGTKRSALG